MKQWKVKRWIWTRANYVRLLKSIDKKKTTGNISSWSVSFIWGDGGVGNVLMQQYLSTKYVTYNIYHPIYNPNGNKYWA